MSFWQNLFFLVAMLASLAIFVCSVISLLKKIHGNYGSDAGRAFQKFTLFVLAAAAVMFLPVYCLSYSFKDIKVTFIRSVLLSVHNAMRIFILDGEFDFVRDQIRGMHGLLHVLFSLYASVLYVAAPVIFTFTIFLTIFRDLYAEFQFRANRRATLYVFSCLNEESAAMAESILMQRAEKKTNDAEGDRTDAEDKKTAKDLIVFCGVPRDKEERDKLADLAPSVPDTRASVLLMGKTVDELDISHFENDVTFFLMEKAEDKNIRDASGLTDRLKKQLDGNSDPNKRRDLLQVVFDLIDCLKKRFGSEKENKPEKPERHAVRILVYASEPISVPLVDAIAQTVSVHGDTVRMLRETIDGACNKNDGKEKDQTVLLTAIQEGIDQIPLPVSSPFSVMRVDIRAQMALRIIRDFQTSDVFRSSLKTAKELTVTLLGMGGIGKEILENLLWMCQQYGRKLIINVVDATGPELDDADPDAARNPLYDRLSCRWPELMETNRLWQQNPESHLDTEAEYDVRFFLGMDCFSGRFRSLFESDSDNGKRLLKSDLVICSLGNDGKNLEAAVMMRQLFAGKAAGRIELKGEGANAPEIYAIIYDNRRSVHVKEQGDLKNYKAEPYNIVPKGSMSTQYSFAGIQQLEKDEKEAIFHHISWICTSTETDENPWYTIKDENKTDELQEQLDNYVHYEYYRRSSLAKAKHKDMLDESEVTVPDGHNHLDPNCKCALCRSRITEHMRWNAYMRVNGYRDGKEKDDMAKIHPCLKPWKELPPKERVKD